MFFTFNTLAQAGAAASVEDPSTLSVVVVGFLFVLIVLALLAAVTSMIGAFFVKQAARDAAKAAEAAAKAAALGGQSAQAINPTATRSDASAAGIGTDGEVEDPVLLAVVAAAVHTAIGDRPHRVVSVRTSGPGWAQEGRRQIFSSHRVR